MSSTAATSSAPSATPNANDPTQSQGAPLDRSQPHYLDLLKAAMHAVVACAEKVGEEIVDEAVALADAFFKRIYGDASGVSASPGATTPPTGIVRDPSNPNLDPAMPQTSDPNQPTGQDPGAPKADGQDDKPAADAPKDSPPASNDPATDAPSAPTADAPPADKPIADKPVADKPVASSPSTSSAPSTGTADAKPADQVAGAAPKV